MHRRVRRVTTSPRTVAVVALALGIAGTVLGTVFRHPYLAALPPLVGLGGLVAVRLHDRTNVRSLAVPSLPRRLVLSAYFLLFSFTVGAYVLNPGYGRPLSVHVALVGLYVLTAVAVFGFESESLRMGLVFVTGIFHRALVYYTSELQLGIDALFHNQMATEIRAAGSLAPLEIVGSKYWYSPVYHLLVGISSSITGLSARDAAFLTVTVVGTILPILVVYALLRSFWSPRVAASGGLLLVMADRVVSWGVHVTPSTLGIVFFALALLAGYRYLDAGRTAYLGLFLLVVVGQMFNHQVSFFVTVAGIGSFAGAYAAWQGQVTRREVALAVPLLAGSVYQGFVTKYDGPRSDQTIVDVLFSNLQATFQSGGSEAFPTLANREAVVAGTQSLSFVHVLGLAILCALTVIGTVFWSKRSDESCQQFVFSLGMTVVTMGVFAFVLPAVGISVHFPLRWFPFLYLCFALLAAPGVVTLLTTGVDRLTSQRNRAVALVLLVMLLFAPYAVAMTWNYPGALDGPVFDSAPGSQRIASTPTEAALYSHTTEFASGSTVVADVTARRTLEHRYDQAVVHYHTAYRRSGPAFSESTLLVDRGYARTVHALYYIEYQDQQRPVFGPLPVARSHYSVVYSAGSDRLLYKPASDSG